MIQFTSETCGNLDAATRREWLETNGIGGFASSTIIGLNTRRYHGLLVASTKPPVGRVVMLSKLEETLFIDGKAFDLSANRYPGVVYPQGLRYLKQFRLDPFPVFTYEVEGVEIEKSVFMVQGENTSVVQYELTKNNDPAQRNNLSLELRPLIAFRDYHSTTHENESINCEFESRPGLATITPYQGLPSLRLAHNAGELRKTGNWYRNFQYDAERERGLDFTEDLFNPLTLGFDLSLLLQVTVIASIEQHDLAQANELRKAEIARRNDIVASSPLADDFAQHLTAAADQYIVSRRDKKTVIAGYHWFSDWGRDTMISLPGLTLPSLQFDVARGMFRTFAHSVSQGMIPNRFPDAGETPEYNTVDATLWFFEAVRAYLAATHDSNFVRQELYNVLADIVAWHVRGTRYHIRVDADGLLTAGEKGVQLTWMDAKVGDHVITPRQGKPVEIQALWYNALCVMADLAQEFEDAHGRKQYSTMAGLARWSFNQAFWREDAGCLCDVIDGTAGAEVARDLSIRPNQILAVSLHYTMLTKERAERLVEVVQGQLLTPVGLRTLAASDPQYRGRYTGGPAERDAAYHQGTVWPWLLGPFVSAYLRVHESSVTALQQAAEWLAPLETYLMNEGVGQIPEIFEGDAPHRACGCPAQAWSVAELLRARAEITSGAG